MSLQVVNQTREWNGGYAALSSFGFGGSNVHLLLQGQTHWRAVRSTRVISVTAEDASLHQPSQEAVNIPASPSPKDLIPLASRTPMGIDALKDAIKVS